LSIEHEQINDKAVALVVKGAKMTGRTLAQAMQAFLKKMQEPKKDHKHGKQSIKSLTKQGSSLSNIEITEKNIGSFKKVARKYNIDFALKRDDAENPPKWLVFFKAKDADALTAAFKEYSNQILKVKAKKPSMIAKLNVFKALAKTRAAPVKNRSKGEIEL
jgi:hypothetical protein